MEEGLDLTARYFNWLDRTAYEEAAPAIPAPRCLLCLINSSAAVRASGAR